MLEAISLSVSTCFHYLLTLCSSTFTLVSLGPSLPFSWTLKTSIDLAEGYSFYCLLFLISSSLLCLLLAWSSYYLGAISSLNRSIGVSCWGRISYSLRSDDRCSFKELVLLTILRDWELLLEMFLLDLLSPFIRFILRIFGLTSSCGPLSGHLDLSIGLPLLFKIWKTGYSFRDFSFKKGKCVSLNFLVLNLDSELWCFFR